MATPTAQSGGSPPLARGTEILRLYRHYNADHPRLRGEQHTGDFYGKPFVGSPPLARGTASEAKKEWKRIGITPACAGNSCGCGLKHLLLGDHPRLRGEQLCATTMQYFSPGSPPLARGTARHPSLPVSAWGITPACAGNRNRHLFGIV